MTIAAIKYLNRRGPRTLNLIIHNLLIRSSSTNDPSTQGPCAQPPKPKDPCSSSSTPSSTCPEPSPCPPMPLCPPSVCPPVMDPGNPCNYCPPPCIDPDYPDLTRLKKNQCFFQNSGDVPIYLCKGTSDAVLYQATILLIIISVLMSWYSLYKMM